MVWTIDAALPSGGEIDALYSAAFPDEDLRGLVNDLLADAKVLSLIARNAGALAGHAVFSLCRVSAQPVALLGPLAVAPPHQKQGLGGTLIQAGVERLAAEGVAGVVLLGDPAYYGRHGFHADHGILAPYDLPAEWAPAWQAKTLNGPLPEGRLAVPAAWQNPAYWQ